MNRLKNIFVPWLIVIGLVVILFRISAPLYETQLKQHSLLTIPPLAKLKPEFIDLMTLGHRGLYDDFATFWAIQILQDENLSTYPSSQVMQTISNTLRTRPRNEYIYLLSCFVFAHDLKNPQFCEDIILLGMEAVPRSWRIPLVQAYIYTSVIPNRYKSALYYGITASKQGVPKYIKNLAKRMLQEERLTGKDLDILDQELLQNERGESILGSPRQ